MSTPPCFTPSQGLSHVEYVFMESCQTCGFVAQLCNVCNLQSTYKTMSNFEASDFEKIACYLGLSGIAVLGTWL